MSRGLKSAGNAMVTLGASAVISLVGVVTGAILSRFLGPAGRGELVSIQSFPLLFTSVGELGMSSAVFYRVARHQERGREIAVTAAVIAIGTGTLVGAMLATFLRVSGVAEADARIWYCFILPLSGVSGLATALLHAYGRFGLMNAVRAASPVAWLCIILISVAREDLSASGVAIRFLVTSGVVGFVAAAVALRGSLGSPRFSTRDIPPLMAFGVPAVLAGLPGALTSRLDQVMMIPLATRADLGIYAAAVSFAGLSQTAMHAFNTAIAPVIASSPSPYNVMRVSRTGAVVAIVSGVAIAAAAPIAIPILFGRAFHRAVLVAAVMSIVTSAYALSGLMQELLRCAGRPRAPALAETVGLAVTVPSLVLLLPRIGLWGAVAASFAGYSASLGTGLFLLARAMGQTAIAFVVPTRDDIVRVLAMAKESIGRINARHSWGGSRSQGDP